MDSLQEAEEVIRKRYLTEAQMIKSLQEADVSPITELSKKYGRSKQAIYSWLKCFRAMNSDEVKGLR